jgi:hypothetical protein
MTKLLIVLSIIALVASVLFLTAGTLGLAMIGASVTLAVLAHLSRTTEIHAAQIRAMERQTDEYVNAGR